MQLGSMRLKRGKLVNQACQGLYLGLHICGVVNGRPGQIQCGEQDWTGWEQRGDGTHDDGRGFGRHGRRAMVCKRMRHGPNGVHVFPFAGLCAAMTERDVEECQPGGTASEGDGCALVTDAEQGPTIYTVDECSVHARTARWTPPPPPPSSDA